MDDGAMRGEGRAGAVGGASDRGEGTRPPSLREFVHGRVTELFGRMAEEECEGIYRLVILEVEGSMVEAVMQQTAGNQGRAARILGINRGTLRKKLREHGLFPWAPQPTGGGDG